MDKIKYFMKVLDVIRDVICIQQNEIESENCACAYNTRTLWSNFWSKLARSVSSRVNFIKISNTKCKFYDRGLNIQRSP